MYTITRNCCLNSIKKKAEITASETNGAFDSATPQDTATPEKHLLKNALYEELDAFVNTLQQDDRELFYLRFSEGLPSLFFRVFCVLLLSFFLSGYISCKIFPKVILSI
ncbi:MAG: hypothetical protein GY757_53180 [bacterium]|nr:hypothetical protein [bacterium]